jgi:uncharacterized protein YjbI with pentapeptide repeats
MDRVNLAGADLRGVNLALVDMQETGLGKARFALQNDDKAIRLYSNTRDAVQIVASGVKRSNVSLLDAFTGNYEVLPPDSSSRRNG